MGQMLQLSFLMFSNSYLFSQLNHLPAGAPEVVPISLLLVVGDLHQLPPVEDQSTIMERRVLQAIPHFLHQKVYCRDQYLWRVLEQVRTKQYTAAEVKACVL